MDDSLYGVRDKRGDWKPIKLIEYPPVFVWPVQAFNLLKWLLDFPGYILPYNLFYAVAGVALWLLMPPLAVMRTFSISWMAYLFVLSAAVVLFFFGAFHLKLYIKRTQRQAFKYNAKWLATDNPVFLFRSQIADNMIRTFASGVPIATAYAAVVLWALANGYTPFVSLQEHPVYSIVLFLLIPIINEVHFYFIHRFLHWPPLYRAVHKLHHNNVNPGPWSGLAMHPVEHLLYFSSALFFWVIPANPVHVLFHLVNMQLAPAVAHVGFDKVLIGDKIAITTDGYAHYLHHKYFECNYSDGVVPLDKWFGSFHDGSPEAQERMNKRFMKRAARRGT